MSSRFDRIIQSAKMNNLPNSSATLPAASNTGHAAPAPSTSSTAAGAASNRRQFPFFQRIQDIIAPPTATSSNSNSSIISVPSLLPSAPLSPSLPSRLELVPVEKKTLDKAYREMDKVVRACQHPRLQLKNSPPYILDILPDMHQHLQKILAKHEATLATTLARNEYFQVFLSNLLHKCKQTLKLFRDSKNRIFEENSDARRSLIRQSLVYSHILTDFKSLFPQPHYVFIGVFRVESID